MLIRQVETQFDLRHILSLQKKNKGTFPTLDEKLKHLYGTYFTWKHCSFSRS